MANPTVIKLQDGNVMPQLGLGVWQASNEEVITAIQKALEVGYRSIDTAAAYKNEEGVGKALKNASVNREELFITTKLWNDDHKRPREALLDSLKKLQLDYIDLYLMHWPVPAIDHYVEAWKGMIELGSSQCWGIQSPLTISLRRAVLSPTVLENTAAWVSSSISASCFSIFNITRPASACPIACSISVSIAFRQETSFASS